VRSDGKLLPAGKFKNAEDKYQELLDRLLAEGPKARFDRTIAQAIAEELPRMGLTPEAIFFSTVSDEEAMLFDMFLVPSSDGARQPQPARSTRLTPSHRRGLWPNASSADVYVKTCAL